MGEALSCTLPEDRSTPVPGAVSTGHLPSSLIHIKLWILVQPLLNFLVVWLQGTSSLHPLPQLLVPPCTSGCPFEIPGSPFLLCMIPAHCVSSVLHLRHVLASFMLSSGPPPPPIVLCQAPRASRFWRIHALSHALNWALILMKPSQRWRPFPGLANS